MAWRASQSWTEDIGLLLQLSPLRVSVLTISKNSAVVSIFRLLLFSRNIVSTGTLKRHQIGSVRVAALFESPAQRLEIFDIVGLMKRVLAHVSDTVMI